MKLIGKLKEEVDQAESMEEKKEIIEDAGIELTDEELDMVAGGYEGPLDNSFLFNQWPPVPDGTPQLLTLTN